MARGSFMASAESKTASIADTAAERLVGSATGARAAGAAGAAAAAGGAPAGGAAGGGESWPEGAGAEHAARPRTTGRASRRLEGPPASGSAEGRRTGMGVSGSQVAETRGAAPHVGPVRVSIRVSPASVVAGQTILPAGVAGNRPAAPP